ncbi:MAG: sigma-E processing peptidase SpoIIGA [Clostridia bacterium]|nr:sigma-E processing peptidase SpoIIGA [Clostridia bacterium]
MEIYIEDVLVSNSIITFIELSQIKNIFKTKSNLLSVVASITSSIFSLIYPILKLGKFELVIFKLLVLVLIVKIAFPKEKCKRLTIIAITFLIYSAIFSGVVYFFYQGNINAMILILPFVFLSKIFENLKVFLTKKLKRSNYLYKTNFILNGKQISSYSFLDSGNSIKYKNQNLMIVNLSFLLKFFPSFKKNTMFNFPFEIIDYIEFESVNTKGKIYITKFEKIVIYTENKEHIFNDIVVGINLNNFKDYDMLFSCENLE